VAEQEIEIKPALATLLERTSRTGEKLNNIEEKLDSLNDRTRGCEQGIASLSVEVKRNIQDIQELRSQGNRNDILVFLTNFLGNVGAYLGGRWS
jgi:predicted  nucleic acid-binding Zn-ribbon protein